MTYVKGEEILFSCDAFGGYGALRGGIFDDQCTDFGFYEQEALRYYVNIVAVFSRPVLQAIKKLADVPVSIIAPSHGMIWRDRPGHIVELYQRWAGYAGEPGDVGVTLIYGTMYGNTEEMMNAVAQGVSDEGVRVNIFDARRAHVSYILPSLWVNRGVIVGAPTYEGSLFPPVAEVLNMAATKRIRNKTATHFGSHGWSGGAQREFEGFVDKLKWEMSEPFEFHGGPTDEDLRQGEAYGAAFARRIKESA